MARYVARLEAQDASGHYREVSIEASDKASARAALEAREQEYADFRLTTEELAAAEKDKGPMSKGHLALHAQEKPYKLVGIEAVS